MCDPESELIVDASLSAPPLMYVLSEHNFRPSPFFLVRYHFLSTVLCHEGIGLLSAADVAGQDVSVLPLTRPYRVADVYTPRTLRPPPNVEFVEGNVSFQS